MSAQTPWHITEASHGTFLCNGNYCVARLSDKDPQELFAQMNSHAQLLAERDALIATTAKLRELVFALDCLSDPTGSLSCAINPGPELNELQCVYDSLKGISR